MESVCFPVLSFTPVQIQYGCVFYTQVKTALEELMSQFNESARLQGPFLRPRAAAAYLSLSPSSLYSMCARGLLPRPLKLSAGITVFSQPALDAAVSSRATEGGDHAQE
jgi:predicted DNA-binding transcriptional regulator AlpA